MADLQTVAEVHALLREYTRKFETGTREDLQAYVHLPIAYVTDDEVQMRERYPFDPERLRELTGIARTDVDVDVIHADGHRAHAVISGVRKLADGSPVERIDAVYILNRIEGSWKITAISGIRGPLEPDE